MTKFRPFLSNETSYTAWVAVLKCIVDVVSDLNKDDFSTGSEI